jgi:hypothetical protein
MRIWKPTMHSIHGLLGGTATRAGREPDASIAQIQDAMVAALRVAGAELQIDLILRIEAAPDPQALWYLRIELMMALAAAQGEALAHEKVAAISGQFEGLLPRSLSTRPCRLGGM